MLFCSYVFVIFFTVVFCSYWALPWQRARVWLLLAASFYFYASWNYWLACLIVLTTTVDYFLALGIEAAKTTLRRRALLAINIAGNLGLLCYFKYANFFLDSLGQGLRSLGLETSIPVLSVLLPVGISFYTFEALNYMIDVYRGQTRAERSLPNFMLFILFFPHLVAGPIVRARDFLPQIHRRKRWSWLRAQLGVQLVLLGLLKKLAVADRMALLVDPVFANPGAYQSGILWLAVIAYALQIYCDFSGYSDMALGTAHLLGYRLVVNFNMPYLAPNIAEFWRRWHISLSTWLRDYLFIPLGGTRGSRWRTCRNLLITMTVCGLWHGPSWNYVAFGLLQGCWLTVHLRFRDFCRLRPRLGRVLGTGPGTALRVACTFSVFCLTLVIFRAPGLGTTVTYLHGMFCPQPGLGPPFRASGLLYTVLAVALCHWLGWNERWKKLLAPWPAPALGLGYALLLLLALLLSPRAGQAFIYFQF